MILRMHLTTTYLSAYKLDIVRLSLSFRVCANDYYQYNFISDSKYI